MRRHTVIGELSLLVSFGAGFGLPLLLIFASVSFFNLKHYVPLWVLLAFICLVVVTVCPALIFLIGGGLDFYWDKEHCPACIQVPRKHPTISCSILAHTSLSILAGPATHSSSASRVGKKSSFRVPSQGGPYFGLR